MTPQLAEAYPEYIIEYNRINSLSVICRTRDYSMFNIIKILYTLRCRGSMTFSNLGRDCKIIMKKSYLNYLHYCQDREWVERKEIPPNVYYSLTDKGRNFLELL